VFSRVVKEHVNFDVRVNDTLRSRKANINCANLFCSLNTRLQLCCLHCQIMRKFHEGGVANINAEEKIEREEARNISIIQAKKRMLGNIRFVGELYKLPQKMLQDKVMHRCVQKLLHVSNDDPNDMDGGPAQDEAGNPELHEVSKLTDKDEEDIESLCKLLTTVGAKLEQDAQKDAFKAQLMNLYFDRLKALAIDRSFPSRMRFMVQDYFELRANSYIPRRKEDKQMTQEEMRKIASREYGRNDTSMGNAMQPVGNQYGGKGKGGKGNVGSDGGSNQPQRGDYGRGSKSHGGGRMGHQQTGQYTQRGGKGADVRRGHGNVRVMQRVSSHPTDDQEGYTLLPQQLHLQQRKSRQEDDHQASPSLQTSASIGPKELEKLLASFLSDWSATRDEADTVHAWHSLCTGGGSVTGALLVNVAIERAADAKEADRLAIADLLVLLCKLPAKGLQPSDFEGPLKQYLEFLEDLLCDIPGLHTNLSQVSRKFSGVWSTIGLNISSTSHDGTDAFVCPRYWHLWLA
jgi:hypothetical protein